MAGNSWGEEAAGDERAWLRGRLRTGNGWGELRGRLRTAADGVGATEWLEMGGEKNKMQPTNLNAHTYVNVYAEFSAIFCLNSLVYTYFPCSSLQCGVDSVECGV